MTVDGLLAWIARPPWRGQWRCGASPCTNAAWPAAEILRIATKQLRAGQPDLDRFERYAASMLAEKEFFMRKAIGWVLREISKRDPGWVADLTTRHASVISGVTFREAIRRLSADEAARLRTLRAREPAGGGASLVSCV